MNLPVQLGIEASFASHVQYWFTTGLMWDTQSTMIQSLAFHFRHINLNFVCLKLCVKKCAFHRHEALCSGAVAETEVEAVPLSWLRSDDKETLCSWPPYPAKATTRIMTAISERTPPGDGWPEYQATIIKNVVSLIFILHFVTSSNY